MPLFNCPRVLEIFEDQDKRLSSTKFCVIMGQIIGAIVVMKLTWTDKLTLDMFSAYLVYSGGLYGFNRYAAASEVKAQYSSQRPEASPAAIVTPPPQPNININMPPTGAPASGGLANSNVAGDANINVQGDANVTKIE